MKISKNMCFLVVLLSSSGGAQAMPDSHYDAKGIDQYGLSRYRVVEDDTYYQSWIKLPWQNDGKEFLTVRQAVNRLGAKKQLAPKLSLWQKQALSSPKNAILQFRYAIGAYRLVLDKQKVGDVDPNLIRKLAWHLSLPENPRAYQYDRLRFLLRCEARAGSSMLPLAKRLQAKDPMDTHASYWLSILRVSSGDISYMESLNEEC